MDIDDEPDVRCGAAHQGCAEVSQHPNVLLMAVLIPDDLARKTYRAIVAEYSEDKEDDCPEVKIGEDATGSKKTGPQ